MSIYKDKFIILIPAYKPDKAFLSLIDELKGNEEFQVLVINDGSGPEFDEIFDQVPKDIEVLSHDVNKGKGVALKTAFDYIGRNASDCKGIVTADADGQHKYNDIVKVAHLIEKENCIVIGCREFNGYVPLRSRFGNAVTKIAFAMATSVKLPDVQTGLRGFSPDIMFPMTEISGSRYEYEINMLLYATQNGIKIIDTVIQTVYEPGNTSSHFSPIRDSLKIYACILKFVASSLFAFLLDYIAVIGFFYLFHLASCGPFIEGTRDLIGKLFRSSFDKEFIIVTLATVLARVISSFVNFMINRKLVFKSLANPIKTAGKFYCLVVCILLMKIVLNNLTTVVIGIPIEIANILVDVTLFFVNFYIQRKVVFKQK